MQHVRVRAAARTDVGRQRHHNEDAYLCNPQAPYFAVIDGVGGYAGGEIAAKIASDVVSRRLTHRTARPERRLREAVTLANNKIYQTGIEAQGYNGMACVLTVGLVEEGVLYVAHVGDTRLYLIRQDQISLLTQDHSVVGLQEAAGLLSETEAMAHPRRNEILRAVGIAAHQPMDLGFIDTSFQPFERDAALVFCSDGLSDMVSSEVIRKTVVAHAGEPAQAAEALVAQANAAGGRDNITVIVVEGPQFGQTAPSPSVPTPDNHE